MTEKITIYININFIPKGMLENMDMDSVSSFSAFMRNNWIFILAFFLLSLLIGYSTTAIAQTSGLDSEVSPTWSKGEEMPTPRHEAAAVAIGDKIYVMGGADYSKNLQGTRFDKVEIYDTQKNKWINSTKPMPVAIDHGAAAVYNDKIYLVGGFIEGRVPTNKLFIYDTIKDEWKEGKPMSSPRAKLAAQFVNGTLYVVGGLNNSHIPLNTMEAYNPQSNTWTSKAPMPTARHHLGMEVIDGKLFALGGRILGDGVPTANLEPTASNFNRNEMYDPQTDKWTVKQPMLDKISGFGIASANGQIYIFGGAGIEGGYLDSVEKYNPLTNKWTYEPRMPSNREGQEAVTVDNKIYTIGGQIWNPEASETGLVALNTNEIFNLKNKSLPIIKDPKLDIEAIGVGLGYRVNATSMDFIDNDNILVLVQTGSVYLVSNGTLRPEPVLNLTVDSTLERGLLGIAISKDNKSSSNGYDGDTQQPSDKSKNVDVFLYFTGWDAREQLKNMVYKYRWNGTKLINPVLILELPALPGPLHNSGKLAIGPDNYLYVTIGDIDRSGRPSRSGILQNIKNGTLPDDTGVILRVNPNDGSPAKNNPFLNNGTFNSNDPVAKYYAYGIRNSFGEAFDPITGQLWITENGPLDYDEINLVKPGFNSGWRILNGPILRTHATHSNLTNLPGSGYSDPVFSWKKTIGVTGMDFASSVLGKKYVNNIFVGDFHHGNLYYFIVNMNRSGLDFADKVGLSDLVADNAKEVSHNIFGTGFGQITEVKTGPDGYLYVLDFSNGRIFRIVPKE